MDRRTFLKAGWIPLSAAEVRSAPEERPQWSGWTRPANQAVVFGFWWDGAPGDMMRVATCGGVAEETHLMAVVKTHHCETFPVVRPGDERGMAEAKDKARELFRRTWGY